MFFFLKFDYRLLTLALHVICFQESSIFEHLRVMIIEDMIYLIHFRALADFIKSSLKLEIEMLFVDLEKDPPKVSFSLRIFL